MESKRIKEIPSLAFFRICQLFSSFHAKSYILTKNFFGKPHQSTKKATFSSTLLM
jgi:hypothetical protein